jgi:very-short-patch-repair endonuclease
MARKKLQSNVWRLVRRQHGVVTRRQLLDLGLTREAVDHRIRCGRLYRLHAGVYAVGRPEVTRHGRWMAAVLACGEGAALSHASAAALWGIRSKEARIEVSVPAHRAPQPRGIRVHRRASLTADDVTKRHGIPVTTPAATIIDLTPRLTDAQTEAAVNAADNLDLIDPERLRTEIDKRPGRPGTKPLRVLLDRATFVLTTSELERLFVPIARRAGLPKPDTQVMLNGARVDFFFAELGLVVEADSLRYHRTAHQQAKDIRRDQAHTVARLVPLRFTHFQVAHEPAYVEATLSAVATRLRAA